LAERQSIAIIVNLSARYRLPVPSSCNRYITRATNTGLFTDEQAKIEFRRRTLMTTIN